MLGQAVKDMVTQAMADIASLFSKSLSIPSKLNKRSVLLKGPSGSGKSYQFRTLVAGGGKGLYVHTSEHMGTVSDLFDAIPCPPDAFPITTYDIPLMPVEKNVEKQSFMLMMDRLRMPDHPYDFVFFDSMFAFADELENYLKYTVRLTGYDLWRAFGEKLRMAMKLFVSLADAKQPKPVDVIATWGVQVAQDWEGKKMKEPIVSGNMVAPRIPYAFDDVFMLAKREKPDGEVEFYLYTGGTHEFDAKVSTGKKVLDHKIINPNLDKIIKKLRGE